MAETTAETRSATEEREWRIRSVKRVREALEDPKEWRKAKSLLDDLEIHRFITAAELWDIAKRQYEQPVITTYLNLTPEKVLRDPPVQVTVFNSLRDRELEARQDLVSTLPKRQQAQLRADLDEIKYLLDLLELPGALSVVIFKSGAQLNRVVSVPVRSADSVTIDIDPYVAPLEAILEEHPRVLVVDVSKEEARFFGYHMGHFEELDTIPDFVPTDTVDAGRPGKVQRHRLTHLQWHLKAAAQRTARLYMDHGFELVVLSGEGPVLEELDRFLPDAIAARVVGRSARLSQRHRDEWRDEVEGLLAQHRRAREEEAVTRLGDYAGSGRLKRGLPEVLEVFNLFLVRDLVVSGDPRQPGFVCRRHHYLSLESRDCAYGDGPLSPTENLADELIEVARLHGVNLLVAVERPELLEPYGGVAAVTYDLEPAPES